MRPGASDQRRDAVRAILADGAIASQGELLRRLRKRGIRASQATLSRDMAALRVRRAVGPEGPRYLVGDGGGPLPLEPVRRLVSSVESNGALVVVRTQASTAAAVARALDEAGLPEVLGTLAGDDTVFVAPRRAAGGAALAVKLRQLFAVG
jgi:transcriptional regulator of arginine metabolism